MWLELHANLASSSAAGCLKHHFCTKVKELRGCRGYTNSDLWPQWGQCGALATHGPWEVMQRSPHCHYTLLPTSCCFCLGPWVKCGGVRGQHQVDDQACALHFATWTRVVHHAKHPTSGPLQGRVPPLGSQFTAGNAFAPSGDCCGPRSISPASCHSHGRK